MCMVCISDLMGMFDKRRFKKLLLFALNFEERNPRTHQDMDPRRTTTRDLFHHFDLGPEVMEFTAHAIALHSSDRSVKTCRCELVKTKFNRRKMTAVAQFFPDCLPVSPAVTWTSRTPTLSNASSCTVNL